VRGPFPDRPDDSIAIGWTRSRLAPKWRAVQQADGTDTAAAEEAFEITWRAAITPWFALQPNLQHVRHPGGTSAAHNATLIGARIELTF
jgi:porin